VVGRPVDLLVGSHLRPWSYYPSKSKKTDFFFQEFESFPWVCPSGQKGYTEWSHVDLMGSAYLEPNKKRRDPGD